MKRESLVQFVLKPILPRLGIPERRLGLHAFRHGLATELADSAVPLPVLEHQLRTRGSAYHVAYLHAGNSRASVGSDGEDRQRNQYSCAN